MKTDLCLKLFAVSTMMMAACACHDVVELDGNAVSTAKLKVVVPVENTKVTSPGNENSISNYQVYIFDDKGVLESYANQAGSDILMDCKTGEKTIAVLTNAPAVNDVITLSALNAKVSNLSDNGNGSFVMAGQQTVTVSGDKDITVSVTRLVSKIRLSKLQVAFEAVQYQNMAFKVSSVYLINVPASAGYFNYDAPGLWYNKLKYVSSDSNVLIYDDMKGVTVNASSPYTTTNTFYCYPNPTANDSFSQTWSARHTRLVVEAYLGNTLYYYPVTLPELERNKSYDVKLTITRPGSAKPDDEVEKYAADFTIAVKNWETGSSVSEDI